MTKSTPTVCWRQVNAVRHLWACNDDEQISLRNHCCKISEILVIEKKVFKTFNVCCIVIFYMLYCYFNSPIALGGKKSPQTQFLNQQKNSVQRWALSFGDFSVYGVGKKCNNQVVNRYTRILWLCWLLWQNRSGISIVVTQVTKSNVPITSTSKKVFQSHCDNERQPEIAIWPPKPEVLISLELR